MGRAAASRLAGSLVARSRRRTSRCLLRAGFPRLARFRAASLWRCVLAGRAAVRPAFHSLTTRSWKGRIPYYSPFRQRACLVRALPTVSPLCHVVLLKLGPHACSFPRAETIRFCRRSGSSTGLIATLRVVSPFHAGLLQEQDGRDALRSTEGPAISPWLL